MNAKSIDGGSGIGKSRTVGGYRSRFRGILTDQRRYRWAWPGAFSISLLMILGGSMGTLGLIAVQGHDSGPPSTTSELSVASGNGTEQVNFYTVSNLAGESPKWCVDMEGADGGFTWATLCTSNGQINFWLPSGTYNPWVWTVTTVPTDFAAAPSGGSFTLNKAPLSFAINFVQEEPNDGGQAVQFYSNGNLLPGAEWCVSLMGDDGGFGWGTYCAATEASGGSILGTYVPEGMEFAWSISTIPHGYYASPSKGSFTLGSQPASIGIAFTTSKPPPPEWTVYFIPTSTVGTWSVNLNGTNESMTSSAEITFSMPNGTYSYSVSTSAGYEALPSSGSVTVAGSLVDVWVTILYVASFVETGNNPWSQWSVETDVGSGCPDGCHDGASMGSTIGIALAPGSHTYQIVPPFGAVASPWSGSFGLTAPLTISIKITPPPISSAKSFEDSTVGVPYCEAPLNMTLALAGTVSDGSFTTPPQSSMGVSYGSNTPTCSYGWSDTNITTGPASNATGTFYTFSWAVSISAYYSTSATLGTGSFEIVATIFTNGHMYYEISGSGSWNTNWIMLLLGWAEELGEGLAHLAA